MIRLADCLYWEFVDHQFKISSDNADFLNFVLPGFSPVTHSSGGEFRSAVLNLLIAARCA